MLACPITGIAEAGMAEAAADRRPFAVATTTPALALSITALAERYGHGALFRGVHLTPGEPAVLMSDPIALEAALLEACRAAMQAGAEAVVIGGGPLACAARAIAPRLRLPVIEPVPAAIRLAAARAAGRVGLAGF
jgi:Asp/Glu/hydantoin racemase